MISIMILTDREGEEELSLTPAVWHQDEVVQAPEPDCLGSKPHFGSQLSEEPRKLEFPPLHQLFLSCVISIRQILLNLRFLPSKPDGNVSFVVVF